MRADQRWHQQSAGKHLVGQLCPTGEQIREIGEVFWPWLALLKDFKGVRFGPVIVSSIPFTKLGGTTDEG